MSDSPQLPNNEETSLPEEAENNSGAADPVESGNTPNSPVADSPQEPTPVAAESNSFPPAAPVGMTPPPPPVGSVPYPPQGVAQVPQTSPYTANMPGYPMPPRADSDFVLALKAIWPTFIGMHKSEGQARVKANSELKQWWWVMMLIFSLLVGLSASVLVARSADLLSGGFIRASGIGSYSILNFGYWFLCFFVFTAVAFAVVLCRAGLALAAAQTRGTTISFTQVASIVATGLVLPSFVLAFMFVIALLPIPVVTTLVISLLQLLLLASFLMLELIIFGGLKDFYPQDKSPEMHHTIFFVIWTLCAGLAIGLFAAPTAGYAVGASTMRAVSGIFGM